jgi:hypothetical protein
MLTLRDKIAKNYINFRGWKTNRKIVVIESDDWGSVRMAGKNAWETLSQKYPQVQNHKFLKYDGLEKKEDLEHLFELLSKFEDFKNHSPVITALALTSNPDFTKIAETNIYHSESIKDTYNNNGDAELFNFWVNNGIKKNLLYPQFHGKEHLFPERYLPRALDSNDIEHDAFVNKCIFGIDNTTRKKNFLAALEFQNETEKKNIEKRTADGLNEFKDLFGFNSKSFCPSQSVYGDHIFTVLKANGVAAIQAGQQFSPDDLQLKKINHNWGDKTSNGLLFWRRNCTFEPYKSDSFDHVNKCLSEIEIAFRWGKPAVINSHRINLTSRLRTDLRDRTFTDIERLLRSILKKWPNVEFVNSAELVEIMLEEKL